MREEAAIIKVAQRKSTRYASFRFYQDATRGLPKLIYKAYKEGQLINKYVAVNISPKDTIEFRVFRGTMKLDDFYGYLLFTDSVIKFCRTISLKNMVSWSSRKIWKTYKEYIITKKTKYSCVLLEYLKQRGV